MNALLQRGFTLIELMVVLVIIGIASAAISLSIHQDPASLLREDAKRLALLLEIAQTEARNDGRSITWLADSQGYRFVRAGSEDMAERTFGNDPQLRPRHWQSSTMQVRVSPGRRVLLDAEWIGEPLRITLSNGQNSVQVQRNALGRVEVLQ